MAIIQDWKIRSTHARCEQSGEPFTDGQEFYTCIFEDPATDGFIRRDYSAQAWKGIRKKLDPAPYSFWKSIYKAPVKEGEKEADSEASIEGMLRRFTDEDDPRTENARYILALMLERNKTLIHTDSKDTETRTLLFYEHADNGDVFIVADPGLRLDEIESVQREVSDLLAEEERRAAEAATSIEAEKEADQHSEADKDESDDQGEKAAESEDEPVALADEEFPEGLGADPGIRVGSELADEVDDEFQGTEHGEKPASDNDEPHADGRID
jgi:hypothetical protein